MQSMLMRVDEIAAATGLKRSSAYRLAMRLKRVKSQGAVLVYRDAFEDWLRQNTIDPQNDATPGGRPDGPGLQG